VRVKGMKGLVLTTHPFDDATDEEKLFSLSHPLLPHSLTSYREQEVEQQQLSVRNFMWRRRARSGAGGCDLVHTAAANSRLPG
jgi:hypothetical protein